MKTQRGKIQLSKIKSEIGDITKVPTGTRKIIRKY